ncbi:MAG: hypothetical protein L0I24_05765 [Pseudonocardia sp.]|nr:hypothetical protein [Pseudonocardia sp.]
MTAVEDLTELATRASRAGAVARSAKWQDRDAIERAAARVQAGLDDERAGLRRSCTTVPPTAFWSRRLDDLARGTDAGPVGTGRAAVAEADAAAAVTLARVALGEAYLAVLRARCAAIEAGDTEGAVATVRGYQPLSGPHPAVAHTFALAAGVRDELRHIVADRPRSVAVRLGIGLGLGLAYLGVLRLSRGDDASTYLPYLAVFALSVVMGSVVCTNAMSMDAARVRAALSGGARLWHLMLSKNLALLCVVGTAGLLLCGALAWYTGDASAMLIAYGELFTMQILWLGVGNVLSVARPLRHEPLPARRHDGTLVPFLVAFAISYGVGFVVNLMLLWRVWAQRAAIEDIGGPWIPVLLTVGSAIVVWSLLTVVAVSLAEQPAVRRGLLRELVPYRAPGRDGVTVSSRPAGRGAEPS